MSVSFGPPLCEWSESALEGYVAELQGGIREGEFPGPDLDAARSELRTVREELTRRQVGDLYEEELYD